MGRRGKLPLPGLWDSDPRVVRNLKGVADTCWGGPMTHIQGARPFVAPSPQAWVGTVTGL